MSGSVIKQTEARGMKRFLGTGLQLVEKEVPSDYASNPCYCPFFLDETCEAAKDPEYKTRCRSETFGYLNCRLYVLLNENENKPQNGNPKKSRVSDPLSDTVIMSAEDICGNHSRKTHSHHSSVDDSIHDRVADGENDEKFGYFRRSLGSVEW